MRLYGIIFLIVLLVPVPALSQDTTAYHRNVDSLRNEFIFYQMKKDSINNVLIEKLISNNNIKDRQIKNKNKQIKRGKFKNFLLGVSLTITIIVISIIQ